MPPARAAQTPTALVPEAEPASTSPEDVFFLHPQKFSSIPKPKGIRFVAFCDQNNSLHKRADLQLLVFLLCVALAPCSLCPTFPAALTQSPLSTVAFPWGFPLLLSQHSHNQFRLEQ